MSDDLISRQAALDELACMTEKHEGDTFGGDLLHWTGIKTMIENLPAIQPQQKTGRWEHDGGRFANRWICSQCGYKFYFEKSEAKYCPNCGAKMESDNNDS